MLWDMWDMVMEVIMVDMEDTIKPFFISIMFS